MTTRITITRPGKDAETFELDHAEASIIEAALLAVLRVRYGTVSAAAGARRAAKLLAAELEQYATRKASRELFELRRRRDSGQSRADS